MVTVIDINSLRIRKSRNPWRNPKEITGEMEELAGKLINNYTETNEFIEEIEGPTEEEISDWDRECTESMGVIG